MSQTIILLVSINKQLQQIGHLIDGFSVGVDVCMPRSTQHALHPPPPANQGINVKSLCAAFHHLESSSKLVGARCHLSATANALQSGYHLVYRHSLHKTANAFQVAITSAIEGHILHNAVFHLYIYRLAACALRHISCLHIYLYISKQKKVRQRQNHRFAPTDPNIIVFYNVTSLSYVITCMLSMESKASIA